METIIFMPWYSKSCTSNNHYYILIKYQYVSLALIVKITHVFFVQGKRFNCLEVTGLTGSRTSSESPDRPGDPDNVNPGSGGGGGYPANSGSSPTNSSSIPRSINPFKQFNPGNILIKAAFYQEIK